MKETGCQEYESLSRRGLFAAAGRKAIDSIAPSWLPSVTYADDYVPGKRDLSKDIIVSVYLRGGCDGLSICVPYADTPYYSHRSTIAIPRPDQTTDPKRATDLDGFFGIPPAMLPIKPVYDQGDFLFVHATGSTDPSRSHFDAQQFMEAGINDPSVFTGWLGRHLATSGEMKTGALLRAIGLNASLAQTLEGSPKVTATPNIGDFMIGGRSESEAARLDILSRMYANAPVALKDSAESTLKTIELLKSINYSTYSPGGGAVYQRQFNNGNSPWGAAADFGNSCKMAAALIKKDVGIEAIHIDMGAWDTHENQWPHEYGQMYNLMWGLSTNLAALYADLTASGHMSKVTVAIVSEFGRIAMQNGSQGTDHGRGNVMMLMGNNVQGGRVLSTWPGLATELLQDQNALKVTIDYRDILAEVVQKRLKNTNLASVFPNYNANFRGVVLA